MKRRRVVPLIEEKWPLGKEGFKILPFQLKKKKLSDLVQMLILDANIDGRINPTDFGKITDDYLGYRRNLLRQ